MYIYGLNGNDVITIVTSICDIQRQIREDADEKLAEIFEFNSFVHVQPLDDSGNKYTLLQILKRLISRPKIGLVYDNAPSHVSAEVKAWIQSHNENALENEKIVVEFVCQCLSSIYQPPDEAMNRPLKRFIRSQYHDYVNQLLKKPATGSPLRAGDPVAISRETLIGFIESAYNKINVDNRKRRWIAESFNQCGLNPWKSDIQFKEYLSKLSENSIYSALASVNKSDLLN